MNRNTKAKTQAEFRHQRRHGIGQNFMPHQPPYFFPAQPGRFDKFHDLNVHGHGPGQAIDPGGVKQRDDYD